MPRKTKAKVNQMTLDQVDPAVKKGRVKKKPIKKPPAPKKDFEFHTVTPEEQLIDGTQLLSFTIPGRPATKKTSQRVVKRGRFTVVLPSIPYEKYEAHCKSYCEAVWKDLGKVPLDFGISVKIKIYLDTWMVGDETGYAQSIGDIIEKHGIIANDMWIHWVDQDSHMIGVVDKDNPRAEITLCRYRHPKEAFREQQEIEERRKIIKRDLKKKDDNND